MDTTLNERFKKIRELLNLSQVEMGEKIFLKQGSITDIERNRIGVSNKVANRLFDVLNVNQMWFYTGKETPFNNVKNVDSLPLSELSKEGKHMKKKLEEYLKENHKKLVDLYSSLEDIGYQTHKLNNLLPYIVIEDISDPSEYVKWQNGLPVNHPLKIGDKAYRENILTHLQNLSEYQHIIIEFYSKLKDFLNKTRDLAKDDE